MAEPEPKAPKRARVLRTWRELARVTDSAKRWLADVRKRGHDAVAKHTTQLAQIERVFEGAKKRLATSIVKLDADTTVEGGALSERCDAIEEQLVAFHATSEFYRARLAQRTEADADALAAADELMWSCYRPMFGDAPPGPPPLTFFGGERTAWAVEHDRPLAPIDPLAGRLNESRRPPVRLLAIPRGTRNEPWSLVFVAHEVGHHVLREKAARGEVLALLEACAQGTGRGADWGNWAEEVFADLFAIAAVGRAFVRALVELLRGTHETLTAADDVTNKYPSRVVRLHLAHAFHRKARADENAASLGELAWSEVAKTLVGDRLAELTKDITIANAIAEKAGETLAPHLLGALKKVEGALLTNPLDAAPLQHIERPRLLAMALTDVWLDGAVEETERPKLLTQHWERVHASGEPGVRAAIDETKDDELIDALLAPRRDA